MAVTTPAFEDNAEATAAWSGVLFERFVRFKHIVTTGLAIHGDEALRRVPPPAGARAVDVGCGFGDTARTIAGLVGPDGAVLGVDVAEPFIAAARAEAEAEGVANVAFATADVQTTPLEGRYDYAFSRFGTMFFASPVAAMRNVRAALEPGSRLCMVVWRRKLDNDWLHRAEVVVKSMVEQPEESDEPRCGPGPFSMAEADTTTDVLLGAGFRDVGLGRFDHPILIGRDLDEALAFAMALGPAGEVIRRGGAAAEAARPRIEVELRAALAEFEGPDGVVAPASTWIVEATA